MTQQLELEYRCPICDLTDYVEINAYGSRSEMPSELSCARCGRGMKPKGH